MPNPLSAIGTVPAMPKVGPDIFIFEENVVSAKAGVVRKIRPVARSVNLSVPVISHQFPDLFLYNLPAKRHRDVRTNPPRHPTPLGRR